MKPVYFPLSYVSDNVAEALACCFEQTVIYHPSVRKLSNKVEKLAKNDSLDIRTPVKGDEERFEKMLDDYKLWSNTHRGNEKSLLKGYGGSIPFFDSSLVSQVSANIRRDIKESGPQEKANRQEADPIFDARMFLHVAHEYDTQNYLADKDLLVVEKMEKTLIDNLTGEKVPGTDGIMEHKIRDEDSGRFMTPERVKAWTALMLQDESELEKDERGLMITCSPDSFEYLLDQAPDAVLLTSIGLIPVTGGPEKETNSWKADLARHLELVAKSDWPGVPEDAVFPLPDNSQKDRNIILNIYLVPGIAPVEFMARCTGYERILEDRGKKEYEFRNTLIGLIKNL